MNSSEINSIQKEYSCEHYKRKCALICKTCNRQFICRHCHNEEILNHELDRKKVDEIVCLECNTKQSVSNECINCKIQFAKYFCEICRLYDDDNSKNIFHCDECGLCRIGKREEYFHCNICNGCFPIINKDTHHEICRQKMLNDDCPICRESCFDSNKNTVILRCKHPIHSECLKLYINKGKPNCPICRKMIMEPENNGIKRWIQQIDEKILENPIPEEMQKKVNIGCIECEKDCETSFHIFGLKCIHCGHYNTYEK